MWYVRRFHRERASGGTFEIIYHVAFAGLLFGFLSRFRAALWLMHMPRLAGKG